MKNKNNGERETRIKKQLISTGVYIALAAAVVGITSNSVKNILGGTEGYDIPEIDETGGSKIVIPSVDEKKPDSKENSDKNPGNLPPQTQHEFPGATVSETPGGVSAEVTDPTVTGGENSAVSGEPDADDHAQVNDSENPGTQPQPPSAEDFDGTEPPAVRVKPTGGYISREFSNDELLYTPTMNDFRTHSGIDITGDIGSSVSAFADGVITDIYNDALMGTTVVIKHSGGFVSSYSNLSEQLPQGIAVGTVVEVGSIIGGIGETAIIESAEVPHVHFELYVDEMCVDPEEYLS